jgi:hypothetical protein
LLQNSPLAQAWAQAPQLLASVFVFTQALPQTVWPVGHWQAPPTQVALGGQA